jgi:hypothetical protein
MEGSGPGDDIPLNRCHELSFVARLETRQHLVTRQPDAGIAP